MDIQTPAPRTNSNALISLVLSLLTMFSCCLGMAPIPFTGLFCLPLAGLAALLAMAAGLVALNQIRRQGGSGQPFAWAGIVTGTVFLVSTVCLFALVAVYLRAHPGAFPLPSIFQKYQL
jgi:hypothetical protein